MDELEALKAMMNSENGGLYAAIGGIVLIYGIDRTTKSHYKTDLKKDSIPLAPAGETKQSQAPKSENGQ